jgi:S-formylglutathione hydrolase FrmB
MATRRVAGELEGVPALGSGVRRALLGLLVLGVLAGGSAGAVHYVHDYILYRGFGPPRSSVPLTEQGSFTSFSFASRALGGRRERVLVYLPPGYASSRRRYPVVYLLHGTPGDPTQAFVNSLHVGPRLDLLLARHEIQPMLVVLPPGSPGTYDAATEWANGPGRGQRWFTYLTHDLVRAVDARFRAVRSGAGRGIGGFSSGANGAINAALLRPGEYRVAEGWSGDYHQTPSSVGRVQRIVRRFSAVDTAPRRAHRLGRTGAFVYLYVGRRDRSRQGTVTVAHALRRGGVHVALDLEAGGHSWILWSSRLDGALRFFSDHLRR